MKIRIALTFITSMFLAYAALSFASDNRYGKQKVVYHINFDGGSNSKRYKSAMGNIRNHINAVGAENIEVKVILHADGVDMLMDAKRDDDLKGRINGLKEQNVEMYICGNTLNGHDIDYNTDLYDVSDNDIIPSGVAELSKLQQEGYTYIKP